ncbi:MAG: transcriptional regulator, partial [Clostridiaceae bacterium]|nr:transcriptional regulator [Clostridiaceae bacterium]
MKRMFYRRLAAALCIALLLLSLPSFASTAPKYESGGMEFMDETAAGVSLYNQEKDYLPKLPDGSAPVQYKLIQGTKLYVNYRVWKDEGVLCYGSYKNVPGNDFKAGTQPPGQAEKHGANDGYYANPKGGSRGEWRYHGWDVSGNRLTNIFFIPDSVVTKFNERDWVKEPWDNLPRDKQPKVSDYNAATTGSEYSSDIRSGVQAWINKSMDQYGGVPLQGRPVDPEVYRYLNVESSPTINRIGQGRMWHKRPNQSIWYQTVAVPVQDTKKDLPVEVKLELLTDLKTIQDVGEVMDDAPLILRYKVSAELKDAGIYDNDVKKTVYYARHDIESWILTFNDIDNQTNQAELPQQQVTISPLNNTGAAEFTLKTTYGVFRSHDWDIYVTAKGQVTYKDGEAGNYDYAALHTLLGTTKPADPPNRIVEDFVPMQQIPEVAFDGVPFAAKDDTDMSKVESRKVFVDGIEVKAEEFFSGSYIFPGSVGENGRFSYVDCQYQVKELPGEMGKVVSRDVVYIYPTKPIANFQITSNTWKQNRIIELENTCEAGNIQLVIDEFPIVAYEWSYGGDTSQLRKGKDTNSVKELLYKLPGIYSVTLRCKNTLGKWSDSYTVEFQVLEDVEPAVGVNLSESVYTRNDKVNAWYYFIGSTDGDVIKASSIELWHDSDNDGAVDKKLTAWSDQEEFPEYVPTRLGYYKYMVTALEDIVSDTLPQHITEADRKRATYEVEFWVDNYQPLSDLYVNIPIQRSTIDIFLMLDKDIDSSKLDYVKTNRVSMSNWLLGKNIIPNISIWDMKTYTYSQTASTSRNTGSSYPSSSIAYSSNGYSGTLTRTSVSNNDYSRDNGHYET